MSIHFNPYLYRSVGCFCTLHTISVQKCMMIFCTFHTIPVQKCLMFLYTLYQICTEVFDVSAHFILYLYRSV